MANPEEAYQIARYIVDCMSGTIRPEKETSYDLAHADVSTDEEGAGFDIHGWTGTFEVVVREKQ
jgi:hypothetical protein